MKTKIPIPICFHHFLISITSLRDRQLITNRHLQHTRAQGVALIIVLAIIVLVATLVIGFLTLATSERRASTTVAQNAETRLLAENAVDLVMGQIRAATTNLGNTKTWASQPGMIRVYGINSNKNNLDSVYKLYSAPQMIVSGGTFSSATDFPSSNWYSAPGIYTDMNEPVTDESGTAVYPIIDGNGLTSLSGSGLDYDANGNLISGKTYSGNNGTPAIEGFCVSGSAPLATTGSNPNPVPMPVTWLYQLKDGTLIAPDVGSGVGGQSVTFTGTGNAEIPTSINPIVGRIAFWTDDETCKVNINTAGEGKMWTSPLSNSTVDYSATNSYANAVPAMNEYSQFPGHPATTCLSTVLGYWIPIGYPGGATSALGYSGATSYAQGLETYLGISGSTSGGISPRIQYGGSQGGMTTTSTSSIVTVDSDRLYATVDELYYSSTRTQNEQSLTPDALAKCKFFLTASSRSPDVTIFNTPQISLWPVQDDYQNAVDKLQIFCSTLPSTLSSGSSGYIYYFQRLNSGNAASSPSAFNGGYSAQNPTSDYNIARNKNLYAYLQNLTALPIPGYSNSENSSSSLLGKYGTADRNQILTEMFDYIRSNVNIESYFYPYYAYSYTPKIISTGATSSVAYGGAGCNSIVPEQIATTSGTTMGFGRSTTFTEAALVFYANHYINETSGTASGNVDNSNTHVRAALILQPFTVTPYDPATSPYTNLLVNFSGNTFSQVGLSASASGTMNATLWTSGCDANATMAMKGVFSSLYPNWNAGLYVNTSGSPFVSNPAQSLSVPIGQSTFSFSGGTITVKVYPGWDTNHTTLIQTLSFSFPAQSLPVPVVSSSTSGMNIFAGGDINSSGSSRLQDVLYNRRNTGLSSQNNALEEKKDIIQPVDVVISSRVDPVNGPSKGDYRIIAAQPVISSNYFTDTTLPSGATQSMTLRSDNLPYLGEFGYISKMSISGHTGNPLGSQASTITSGSVTAALVDSRLLAGSLIQGLADTTGSTAANYSPYAAPYCPQGMTAALNSDGQPGDWDNGISFHGDGPFINTPDVYAGGTGNDYWSQDGNINLLLANGTPRNPMPSAVMFGSLPTGVYGDGGNAPRPWQTLLFCPNPPSRKTLSTGTASESNLDHFGFGIPGQTPPDHIWLSLFHMPVVQPYAISDPLSTAGRINMNYEIEPFTYIDRSTGIRAVLKGMRICAIPTSAESAGNPNLSYKQQGTTTSGTYSNQFYYDVNRDQTMTGFQQRFNPSGNDDIFHSASEICSIFLVPQAVPNAPVSYTSDAQAAVGGSNPTYAQMVQWWSNFPLTGDNTREAPYNDIYPRLTTQSNSYRVHVRVQALRQSPSDSANGRWTEGKSQVIGEYRGSYLIERYVDPNDPNIPDYATMSFPVSSNNDLGNYYRFRVLERKQFAP